MNELTHLQRQSMHALSRAQLFAFLAAAFGIVTIYVTLTFFSPGLLALLTVLFAYASCLCGVLLLIEIWWYTSIQKTLVQTLKLYKLAGLNLVITCVSIVAWLLYINELFSLPIAIVLLGIVYLYSSFNSNWGRSERVEQFVSSRKTKIKPNMVGNRTSL
jgi:hypothetical protein